LKAVLLWIHGGGFSAGSGSEYDYDPVNFMEKDVVVVAINYRLGPLGFLTFGNDMASGNLGLRDQQLAIQWTRNYIQNFGGDPNKITIFGESAGGMSVHAQVLSPHNQGLIHGAISQSGTMLSSPIDERPERTAVKVAERFNCSSNNLDEEMLDCLQEIPAQELIEGTALEESDVFSGNALSFYPVVDHFCTNPFMPVHPLEALKTGTYNNVPFMSGTTKEDGALYTMIWWDVLEQIEENWDIIGPRILQIMKGENDIDEEAMMMAQIVKKYYTGADFTQENKDSLTAMFGDAIFLAGDQKAVSLMSEGSAPVFNYVLTYTGSNSAASLFTDSEEDFGVVHGDDLQFLFQSQLFEGALGGVEFTEDDTKMIDLMVTYWSNFAKYGNPSPFRDASVANWTPVRPDQKNYLDLQLEPSMKKNLAAERMLFWERMKYAPKEEDIEQKVIIKKAMKFFMKNYASRQNTY
jgi:carboxylesterase type B